MKTLKFKTVKSLSKNLRKGDLIKYEFDDMFEFAIILNKKIEFINDDAISLTETFCRSSQDKKWELHDFIIQKENLYKELTLFRGK